MADQIIKAACVLRGEAGVSGEVILTQSVSGGPTTIRGQFRGLNPGRHGFHIHAFGDLSQGCVSAGPHYNPFGKEHGSPNSETRHVGDLGNLEADASGNIQFEMLDNLVSLVGPYSVIGRSLIIHADEDDLGLGNHDDSKTTGHAGARVACGVIGLAQP
eukprot:GILI01002840.1.p1 GENE.GILI01002840.1~~GILI01002840.1.p1  ORF type:complete len:159 (-),score=42.39 GILI01002840.1:174-650(-)